MDLRPDLLPIRAPARLGGMVEDLATAAPLGVMIMMVMMALEIAAIQGVISQVAKVAAQAEASTVMATGATQEVTLEVTQEETQEAIQAATREVVSTDMVGKHNCFKSWIVGDRVQLCRLCLKLSFVQFCLSLNNSSC